MADVSVIVPTCDRPSMLAEALDTVRAQLPIEREAELLVVENGWEPVPESVKERFAEFCFLRIPPRPGVSVARNWGAMEATGRYLAFLDDDDLWPAGYLREILDCADRHGSDLVAAPQRLHGTDAEVEHPLPPDGDGRLPRWRDIGYRGSNILVRRSSFWRAGGFPSNLITGEDRALAINISLARMRIDTCPETFVWRRYHAEGQLTDTRTLMLGKLCFLNAYEGRMPKRDLEEDRLAFVFNLSRAWRWPLWPIACLYAPRASFRRLKKRFDWRREG